MPRPLIYAHRGASRQAPENTMAAFDAAIAAGADGVEFDVQLSADGIPVVIHDECLERTTGEHGLVADYHLDRLRELDAGSWFSPAFHQETIPTLAQVLNLLVPHDHIQINIELKTGVNPYPGIEAKVLAEIKRYHLSPRVIVSSFNHYTLLALKALAPDLPVGLLYDCHLVDPWDYATRLRAQALHPFFTTVTSTLVKKAHEHGLKVNPWTVDQEAALAKCILAEVDGIITNLPDRLRTILDGKK